MRHDNGLERVFHQHKTGNNGTKSRKQSEPEPPFDETADRLPEDEQQSRFAEIAKSAGDGGHHHK